MPARMALALASRLVLAPPPVASDPAPAEPPAASRFEWISPATCPDASQVREAIERYTGRKLDDTGALLVAATAEVDQESNGDFRLRLDLEVAQGAPVQRLLHDPSCEVLAETAALMIAVTIDPTAVTRAGPLREKPPEPEPEKPPVIVPVIAPPAAVVVTPAKASRRCDAGRSQLRVRSPDWRPCVGIDARAGAQLGVLPGIVGPGISVELALLWPRLRLEIGGHHWFRRPARIASDPPRGGDVQLTAGSLGACARLRRGSVEFPLCGGGEIGALDGRGVGVDVPQRERVLWFAAWVGPRLAWLVHPRVAVLGGVDLVVPLARYRFEVEGLGVVHRVGPVGGRVRLGLGVRL